MPKRHSVIQIGLIAFVAGGLVLAQTVGASPFVYTSFGSLTGPFIPLHHPDVEGVHPTKIGSESGGHEYNSPDIRTYVQVDPDGPDFWLGGQVTFIIGHGFSVDSNYLWKELGAVDQLGTLDDNPVPSEIDNFQMHDLFIYDFADLLENPSITNGPDVSYVEEATAGALGSGTHVNSTSVPEHASDLGDHDLGEDEQVYQFSKDGSADDRIDNPSEWVALTFDYKTRTDPLSLFRDIDQIFIGYSVSGSTSLTNNDYWTTMPIAETGQPIPEPSTLLLLGTGLVGMVCWRRRR